MESILVFGEGREVRYGCRGSCSLPKNVSIGKLVELTDIFVPSFVLDFNCILGTYSGCNICIFVGTVSGKAADCNICYG
jgi:hypothetical protein